MAQAPAATVPPAVAVPSPAPAAIPPKHPRREQGGSGNPRVPTPTVLIEVQLSLDGLQAGTCRVCAADRCCEVAERFVDENSLKECFAAPLSAYLKQAEAEAERFPVVLAADL